MCMVKIQTYIYKTCVMPVCVCNTLVHIIRYKLCAKTIRMNDDDRGDDNALHDARPNNDNSHFLVV